jgi:hypothetical protein
VFGYRGGTGRVKTGPERVLNAALRTIKKIIPIFWRKHFPHEHPSVTLATPKKFSET